MSRSMTSVVEEHNCQQSQYNLIRTEQYRSLLPDDIFIEGEKPLFESRSLFWPLLINPVVLSIVGVFILLFVNHLPLAFIGTLFEEPSTEIAIRNIIKWLGIGIILIGALGITVRLLRWRFTIYTATNFRIIRQTGIVTKSYQDCSFSKIQTLHLLIPLLGRIFSFGTIRLATIGRSATDMQWENLKNPKYVYRKLSEIMEKYRQNKL